jgi:hypothetical protein
MDDLSHSLTTAAAQIAAGAAAIRGAAAAAGLRPGGMTNARYARRA